MQQSAMPGTGLSDVLMSLLQQYQAQAAQPQPGYSAQELLTPDPYMNAYMQQQAPAPTPSRSVVPGMSGPYDGLGQQPSGYYQGMQRMAGN